MAQISRNALVPYTPEQMYALVDGIEDYPNFLPWCRSSEEFGRDAGQVKASVEIAKGVVNKTFTTLNKMQPGKVIEMSLIDGPFKQLHGFWRFDELKPGACKVSLELNFEFSNKLVGMAIGPVFNQVANTLVDSFVERARSVYGKG
ncbi:MAG: Putative oligoketide cyclase/lipid transport protein, similarity with yeast ubiquinone-binding protein YOL008W [uncultured Thiotrichaceae bacterium]|uniref:Oligoketide cyclase/lipid transport protein, similarity with yeast ubiquinone-binding protein YOL008W n=1 Tax=uncultured Thiotrichaceae bacterium TaxID=298394 RepID=A0A6S6T7X0_9GAMM|nr:MAG: Putative oligoketide cyclase/lipid transport protein, similarity with yeast ubiquinone-binding protein YOL008W [uncultured Thiotrichaceae bacterium]